VGAGDGDGEGEGEGEWDVARRRLVGEAGGEESGGGVPAGEDLRHFKGDCGSGVEGSGVEGGASVRLEGGCGGAGPPYDERDAGVWVWVYGAGGAQFCGSKSLASEMMLSIFSVVLWRMLVYHSSTFPKRRRSVSWV
jgi:hypothetical protein